MSQTQNTRTVHCASEEVIQTVSDASVHVLGQACDVITVVHVNDSNDDHASSICSDSTMNGSIVTSCEPYNSGMKIIENLGFGDQRHVTYNNIQIDNSTDIVLGTKAIFNEPVVIQHVQQLIVNGDSRIVNHSQQHGALPDNEIDESLGKNSDRSKCTFRVILIVISVFSLLCSMTVAGYFLYVQITALHAGAIFVCKSNGTDTCYIGSSTFACSNLVSSDDRPYISGHTTADSCKIYSRKNCLGDVQWIGTNHTIFDFNAWSASCYKKIF